MTTLIRNDRVRVILLNATLLILFASAWVADRKPDLIIPAIITAFIVVFGEALFLYVMARRAVSSNPNSDGANAGVRHADHEVLVRLARSRRDLLGRYYANGILSVRPVRESTLSIAAPLGDPLHNLLPYEMRKWKLTTHSEEAFSITAGSFEIEFFHGQTNIRVLDSSRVTVEDAKRGIKSKVAPPEIRPPVYQ